MIGGTCRLTERAQPRPAVLVCGSAGKAALALGFGWSVWSMWSDGLWVGKWRRVGLGGGAAAERYLLRFSESHQECGEYRGFHSAYEIVEQPLLVWAL